MCGRRRRSVGITLALMLLAGGCDEVPVTSVAFRIEDPWAIAQGAMPLPVVLTGAAFTDAPPPLVAERVVVAMAEAVTWSRGARFVLVPVVSSGDGLRIVIGFNGAAAGCGRLAGEAATPAAPPASPPPNRIALRAVFCDGDRLLADVSGRLGRAQGPGDRRFLALIRQVTGDLLRPPPAPRP